MGAPRRRGILPLTEPAEPRGLLPREPLIEPAPARGLPPGARFLMCLAVFAVVQPPLVRSAEGQPELTARDREVQALIAELGHQDFVRRERAQAELERLGLEAFDALREAQDHEDIEIALRARYLVRRLQVRWFSDQDPPEVRRALRDYGQLGDPDRRSRMDRLALLPEGQGLPALCRLVRFEADLRLAKYAALLIMKHGDPGQPESRALRGEQLREAISLSRNPAAQWVKGYANLLLDPAAADAEWTRLVGDEQRAFANFPEQTSPELLMDLLRWRADRLLQASRRDEAVPLIRDSLDLLTGRREQLLEAVDWLIARSVWPQVEELATRFADTFRDSLVLQYRLAEVQAKRGDQAAAEQVAAAALATKADQFEEHLEASIGLQERGLFPWAEREYRHVITAAGEGSVHNLRSRLLLAEMLHDQLQELAAAETLKVIADAMQGDAEYLKRVRALRSEPEEIPARMHFFFAEYFAATDRQRQKEHLLKGIEVYPREIDLLIAMYRFPDADEPFRQKTMQHIQDTAGHYRDRLRQLSDILQQNNNPALEDDLRAYLGRLNNQLAWLIANTEGDFDEALRCSQQSLEYLPDVAGYLDTLARCYYAKKDYVNAVRHQSRAAELDPHAGQIRRQLALFQRALAESQAQAPP